MYKIKLIKNKYYVDDNNFHILNEKGYGVKSDKFMYELNDYEVVYLLEFKKAQLINAKNELIGTQSILKNKNFNVNIYYVYKNLREKGYILKSGLKYGFTFRIYDKGIKPKDDHSLWLVEIFNENKRMYTKEIVRLNRIAHSVGKKTLLAIVDNENSITYIETNWKRT